MALSGILNAAWNVPFGGQSGGPLTLGATSIWNRTFGVVRCAVIIRKMRPQMGEAAMRWVIFLTTTASLFCVSGYIVAQ